MAGVILPFMIMVRRGDSFDIVLQLRHDNATGNPPMDLTDCEVKMTVKTQSDRVLFSKIGEIFEPLTGRARIKLTSEETNAEVGDYRTDIQLRLKTGDVHTIYPGDVNKTAVFRITREVTE